MRRTVPALAFVAASLLALPPGAAAAAPAVPAAAPGVPGLIVRLKDAPPHVQPVPRQALAAGERAREDARWQRTLTAAGLAAARRTPTGRDQHRIAFDRPLAVAEAEAWRARLARDPAVDWVELDARERRLSVPADPLFASQWWLQPAGGTSSNVLADRRRGAPGFQTAWASGLPGALGGATVAVLDTGVTAHPELAGRVLPGHDFVSDAVYANDGDGRDADPSDPGDWVDAADLAAPAFDGCVVEPSSWHGTIVAGILAAGTNDGAGVASTQWAGRVLPVRVAGKCGATVSDIVDGMRWAGGLAVAGAPPNPNPARVLNISFGGDSACGPAYQTAVDELRAAGVVVVAAAGNEGALVTRPASCAGVVGVVSLNRDGFKSSYSSFGTVLSATGLATVGGDGASGTWGAILADPGVLTLDNEGRTLPGAPSHAAHYGTSFATPVVAGAAALMLSVNPALTATQLLHGLGASARPHVRSDLIGACSTANPGRCICSTSTCGRGILDVPQALLYAAAPDTYVPPAAVAALIDSPEVAQAVALGPDVPGATPPPPPATDGGGGGGAFGPIGVLGLIVAAAALRRGRPAAAARSG